MWRGSRIEGAEYFDDVLDETKTAGIFSASDGIAEHDSVRTKMDQDGILVEMNCRSCGRPAQITIEWPELFLCAHGVLPRGWKMSAQNGAAYPALDCSRCGASETLCPLVTPDEAGRHLKAAVSRGIVPQQSLAQWQQSLTGYGG